jgi:hypothetical protein
MRRPDLIIGKDERITLEGDNNKELKIDGKLLNQSFSGVIDLSNDLTHYANYTPSTNIAVVIGEDPIIGGSAEIRMIGNGTNTPTFAAFTKSSTSSDYSPTLAAINKIVFYYDGTEAFYSITVL